MTDPSTSSPDDDELPPLAPLDTDEGAVDVPDDLPDDPGEGLDGDDEVLGVDLRALAFAVYVDGDPGEDDEGTPDDPMDALPDDDRGGWVGDDERAGDEAVEIDEPARDVPDGGEDGPSRDPYDEADTALPALDDGDDDEPDASSDG
jgi:hypothetical protein